MRIKAPFSKDQIKNIQDYQMNSFFHPFTCPHRGTHKENGVLIPTINGMICNECNYIQEWVHDFMTSITNRKVYNQLGVSIRKSKIKKIIKII